MPIFEYECKKCQKRHELLVRSVATEPVCPDCGGVLTKLLSVFGVKSGGSFTPSTGGGGCPPSCGKGSCSTCH